MAFAARRPQQFVLSLVRFSHPRHARQKMPNKDSPTLREEERRSSLSAAHARASIAEPSIRPGKSKDELQAEEECKACTVSKPGGFRNDPDDPTNPNEVRERYLRKLRELTYGRPDNAAG
jgi:hypothetical protein